MIVKSILKNMDYIAYLLDLQTTKTWHDPKKIDIKIGEVLLI